MCYLSNRFVFFPELPRIMLCNVTGRDDRLLGFMPANDL